MQARTDLNTRNNLAEQSYWDEAYANMSFGIIPKDDIVRKWLEEYIPRTTTATCFEVGCFPGRYLAVFGELGYELNGVDLTPRVETDLPRWLMKQNYRVGNFTRSDIFTIRPDQRYDVVSSFGFIEHFRNWQEVVQVHMSVVKPGGLLVLETPNFAGTVQRFIHAKLDWPNLVRHNLSAMNPDKWRRLLEDHGYKVSFCGYFGSYDFWIDQPPQTFGKKLLLKALNRTRWFFSLLPPGRRAYSPYIGIIAQKPNR